MSISRIDTHKPHLFLNLWWAERRLDSLRPPLANDVIFDRNYKADILPEAWERDPMDRLVCPEQKDTAAAHLTENGHIKHRLLEIGMRVGPVGYAA